MFFNLAWRNAKRSRGENLIYFLTMVTAASAFYIVLSLSEQDVIRFLGEIESAAVGKLLSTVMPAVYLCALLFVFFLITFANKYQLECRSKELALYMLFGMKKQRLFLQILAEGFITSLLALCGGIVCGGFLSEIISLTTARLVGQGIIAHQSSLSIRAIILTGLGFLLIQAAALFILGGQLFRKEIHQLLYGETAKKQQTGNAGGNIVMLVLGAGLLAAAYWIVLNHFMVAGGALLLVAVLLGTAGTLFVIRGLARLLSIVASSIKSKSTQGLYTFTLRQVQENIANKYISVSVASIIMMLTIMLIADGSVTIMTRADQLTRGAAVYDFTVIGEDQAVEQYLTSEKMAPYVSNINRLETATIRRPDTDDLSSFIDWAAFRAEVVRNLPPDVKDPAEQGALQYEFGAHLPAALNLLGHIDTMGVSPYLIPISSYNRLLEAAGEKAITLTNNEAILYLNPDFFGAAQEDTNALLDQIAINAQAEDKALIAIEGQPFYLIPYVPQKGITADENAKITRALIVSDEVYSEYARSDRLNVYWNFCIPENRVETDGLLASIMEASHILQPSGFVYESYLNNFGRQLFYVISESYTTLYMGFMFLIIACAVLALQFLTQMQDTKTRYLTLTLLGAQRRQMKKSVHKQVVFYFLLPMILACISGTVGLIAMQKHLHSGMEYNGQIYLMFGVMAGLVILTLAVYGIAVARTANREIAKLQWKSND